jgi:16S rRNA C1402 (ribose-2'-O) methylase RsmI
MVDGAFVFLGFAPSRRKLRRDLLLSLRPEKRQLVFFEGTAMKSWGTGRSSGAGS